MIHAEERDREKTECQNAEMGTPNSEVCCCYCCCCGSVLLYFVGSCVCMSVCVRERDRQSQSKRWVFSKWEELWELPVTYAEERQRENRMPKRADGYSK